MILALIIVLINASFLMSQETPDTTNQDITPLPETVISPTAPVSSTPNIIIKRFEGLLDNVKDNTPLEQDQSYTAILEYIASLSQEEISKKARSDIAYKDLMTAPEKYRGEIIRCDGLLLHLSPYRLKTNPAGIEFYYAGMMVNPATPEPYDKFRFHVIEKPTQSLRNLEDDGTNINEIIVEGAFLKIAAYEIDPSVGRGFGFAPFIIGRKIEKAPQIEPKTAKRFQNIIGIGLGIILIAIFAYIILAGRKDRKKSIFLSVTKTPPTPQDSSGSSKNNASPGKK